MPPAVRLKQSVQNNKNLHHRNSASLGSTNLQEELLKLINPDYLSDSESMGAEIREKNELLLGPPLGKSNNAFPTYQVEETKGSTSINTRQPPPTYPGDPPQLPPIGSHSGIYDCLPISYQTIGAAEFTSRKNVFTRPGDNFNANEGEVSKETSKPGATQENLILSSARKPQTSKFVSITLW